MFKSPQAKISPQGIGIRVKSSIQAQAVPIVLGRAQTVPKIIWKSNLQTHNNSGKKGKSFKSAKKGGGSPTTYTANFDMLLGTPGFGRIRQDIFTQQKLRSILDIWSDKDKFSVTIASQLVVVSGGQATIAIPGGGQLVTILAITVPRSYSVVVNDYGGPGAVTLAGNDEECLWNSDETYYDETAQIPIPGVNRTRYYTRTPEVGSSTLNTVLGGVANGTTVKVYFAYTSSAGTIPLTVVKQSFESLLGNSGVSGQPITYGDVGGVGAANLDLGSSGAAPNYKYETLGWGGVSPSGDLVPIDALTLLMMGPHGLNISGFLVQSGGPATVLGSLTAVRNYCLANGIFVSCYIDQQQGTQILSDLLDIMNCATFWSEGVYKFAPWSEVSAVGSGVTYNAPTASGPAFQIFPSDLLADPGKAPIVITREKMQDVQNVLPIEFTDRGADYTTNSVNVPESESVSDFGPRVNNQDTKQLHWLMSASVAKTVGGPMIRRMAIQERTTIKFRLSPRFIQLEPMDLVEVTDPLSGFDAYPVRVKKVTVNENMSLDVEGTPFYYGANAPVSLDTQGGTPSPNRTNVLPGNAGTPEFIEPTPRLLGGGQPELWIAIPSTSSTYGGCEVWLSVDGGTSYISLGRLLGKSTVGQIAAASNQPIANDPDTTNDFNVDMAASLATLESWSSDVADAFLSLIYVAGGGDPIVPYEIEAYTTATLIAANKYTLKATGAGNEIRRSVYGAPTVGVGKAHPTASRVVYLEDPLFKVPLDPKWIGKALKFKFTAFNIYGTQEQSLADVSPVSYTPTGVAAQLASAGGYTISPAQPLSQAAVTYAVAMAQATATFLATGQQTNYNARSFGVGDPGVGNTQQYWVTVYDPNLLGDTGAGTTLNAYCDNNQTRWNTAGYIRIGTIVVTHAGSVSGGGGGSGGSGFRKLTISQAADGSRTAFSLDSNVSAFVLWIDGVKVNDADITFVAGTSTFTLSFAPPAGAHMEAYGV